MQLIDGKKLAADLVDYLASKIEAEKYKLTVCIYTSGEDPASQIYIRNKKKVLEKAGVQVKIIEIPICWDQQDLIESIQQSNQDPSITGILVQLPLSERFDEDIITNAVVPEKDLDGFTDVNLGKLFTGKPYLAPCTPKGIVYALKMYNINLRGANVVIVGRSNIVGKPLAALLTNLDATVTLCHSKTKNLKDITSKADILIAAIGKPNFITKDMIKKDSILIDVGINRIEDKKIVGDVDFESVKNKASLITPVPGGVGPLTVAMVLDNAVTIEEKKRRLS